MARAEIKARATLDNKQFVTGVTQMQQGVQRFASGSIKTLGGIIGGAFAAGAVVNFGKELFNTADAIDNTARQLGVGREELQALQRQTELTTGSAEKMTSALLRIARAQAQAVGGESTPVRAFEQLGISMEEIQTLDPARLFERVAKSVSGAGSVSKEASGASLILGRSYAELTSVIDTLANDGLDNLKNQMLETNQIMSEEAVIAADAMEESFNRAMTGMTNTLRAWTVEAMTGIQRVAGAMGELQGRSGNSEIKNYLKFLINPFAAAKALGGLGGHLAGGGGEGGLVSPTAGGAGGGAGSAEAAAERIARVAQIQAPDQVAKIGGILGAQGISNQERMAREQMELQRMANEKLDRIADASKKTEENTQPLKED